MNCTKCNSTKLIREPWTQTIAPNVYKNTDRLICKDCKNFTVVDLDEVDKNNDNTKKLLTGNYFINKDGKVVLKGSEKKSLKNLAKKAQEELNLDDMFKD